MATRDSIQFALKQVEKMNAVIKRYEAVCNEVLNFNTEMDAIIADTPKKNLLIDGLTGLSLSVVALNTERNTIKTSAENALSTMPIVTK